MRVHVRPPCGRLMRQFLGAWFAPEPYDVAIEPHQELWAEHIKEYSDDAVSEVRDHLLPA